VLLALNVTVARRRFVKADALPCPQHHSIETLIVETEWHAETSELSCSVFLLWPCTARQADSC